MVINYTKLTINKKGKNSHNQSNQKSQESRQPLRKKSKKKEEEASTIKGQQIESGRYNK